MHELAFAFCLYTFVERVLSPILSRRLFPKFYNNLNDRTKLSWDVHSVSMVQSCIVNTLALWVLFCDEERKGMNALERIYGYTGASGLVQGMAGGYFLWDLITCTRHFNVFGPGLWAHGLCAFSVFSLGYRPFCNYYGTTFILYELSSPFLNVHWFCDKLNLTGSRIQWYNGMVLLASFFGCRLVWGGYQSVRVYQDVWAAMHLNTTTMGYLDTTSVVDSISPMFVPRNGELCLGEQSCVAAQAEVMKFAGPGTRPVPIWLGAIYLAANILLNSLNIYWFGRMIDTVTKRFKEARAPQEGRKERKPSIVMEVVGGLEQDDRMHGSMPSEDGATTTGTDGGVGVKKR